MESRYYFSVCQFGAEKAVKDEVLAAHSGLRFAYSRPGFVTFKDSSPSGPEIRNPSSLFTRLWGVGLGQAGDRDAAQALVGRIPPGAVVQAFDRDTCLPGDEPEGFVPGSKVAALLRGLSLPSAVNAAPPRLEQEVHDLIWVDEGRLFLGRHWLQEGVDPSPGNQPILRIPSSSPSRAWLKLEEAIHRFRPPVHDGLRVLEVGCSPGGATTCMLDRGFEVRGIDPKKMAPSVEARERFRLIQKTAGRVVSTDLRGFRPDWIVMDMNLAPLEALDELHHAIRLLRAEGGANSIARGFLTLKLNDWSFVREIPLYFKRISEIGFGDLSAVQLCSNRQEFFVHARSFR